MADKILKKRKYWCVTEAAFVTSTGYSETDPGVCPNNVAHTITPSLTTTVDKIYVDSAVENAIRETSPVTVFDDLQTSHRIVEVAESFIYPAVNTKRIRPIVLNGGTVTVVNQMLVASTGISAIGSAEVDTVARTTYIPGREMFALMTPIFENAVGAPGSQVGVAGCDQQYGFFTDNFNDGFGFQLEGATAFKAIHRQAGITVTSAPQSAFNRDTLDGSGNANNPSGFALDLTKVNIIRIKFGYLGTAPAEFWINTGAAYGGWVLFHLMDFPNTLIRPHIANTSLGFHCKAVKTTGATNVVIKTVCWSAGYSGIPTDQEAMTDTNQEDRVGVILGGNFLESYVMTIRSPINYQGVVNNIIFMLKQFSIVSDNGKEISLRIFRNATLIGLPVFVPHNALVSCMEYDITATGRIGGKMVGSSTMAGKMLSHGTSDLKLNAGDTLTFVANTKTSGIGDFFVEWKERR